MSYLIPSEFVTKMVDAGESKIYMSTRDTVIRAYMAGAILALAAMPVQPVRQPAASVAQSAPTQPAPAARPDPTPAPQHEAPALGPAARGGHAPESQTTASESFVVPVRIPKGMSREIVLRIVISNEDDAQAA